jgi:hypothetical protein
MNNGNGTFATKVDYPTGATANDVALGDINGDGKLDIVTDVLANTLYVLINNGDGTFAPKVAFTTGGVPSLIALGDLNGDGKIDVAVSNDSSASMSVFINQTSGTFGVNSFAAKADYITGAFPWGIAMGDVNGDGKPDIAVANFGPDTVSVFINNATPTLFTSAATGNVGVGTSTPYSKLSVWGGGTGTGQIFSLVNNASTTVLQALDNGNIGIGTTSPYAALSVVGASGVVANMFTATSTSVASLFQGGFLAYSSSTIGNGTQAGGLTISGGATTTGNAYFAGNVGIGTTTPRTKLTIQQSGDSTLYTGNQGLSVVGSNNVSLQLWVDGSGGKTYIQGVKDQISFHDLLLEPHGGNVGIGVSPSYPLQVAGQGRFSGLIFSDAGFSRVGSDSAAATSYTWDIDGDTGLFHPAANTIGVSTNGLERLRFDSAGNIGVGTTSPFANRCRFYFFPGQCFKLERLPSTSLGEPLRKRPWYCRWYNRNTWCNYCSQPFL